VLTFVDKTLRSATEAGKKTSPEADKQIEGAIQMLSEYQTKYHPTHPVSNVRKRMEEARQNDECSSTILNRLKESFRVRDELAPFNCFVSILILIPSQLSRNRRGQSSFLSTSLFLIGAPPV
jgi:hypothetical protein